MDDRRVILQGLGPTAAIHGDSSLTAAAGGTTTTVPLSGSPNLDTDLAGPRGTVLRWGDDDANEAVVLFADGTTLHLDRPIASAIAATTALRLGNPQAYWESKWFDFGDAWADKKGLYLDFVFQNESSGTVAVTAFADGDDATEITVGTITLSGAAGESKIHTSLPLGTVFGKHMKFRLESYDQFEVTEMTVRVDDTEQD